MLNSKLKRTTLALVLAVVLMLSLFPITTFAALEDAGVLPEGATDLVLNAGLTTDTADTSADTTADTTAEEPSETEAETPADTTATPEPDEDDKKPEETTPEGTTTEEKKGFTLSDIISLALLGVVIILVVIYCLTHKEKVGKLWRGLKSEFKKIVWTPWNQVRKNTIVVLVVIIAAVILIGLLDFLFSQGILALSNIF